MRLHLKDYSHCRLLLSITKIKASVVFAQLAVALVQFIKDFVLHRQIAPILISDRCDSHMNRNEAESFRESRTSGSQSGQLLMHTRAEAFTRDWLLFMAGAVVLCSSEK